MINALASILVSLLITVANLYLLSRFKCRPWRIQLYLKEQFPSLPPWACRTVHYLYTLFAITPLALVFIFSFYCGPYELGMPTIMAACVALYLTRCYISFAISTYWPSVQWRIDWIAKFLEMLQRLVFWIFQILACCFLADFDSRSYAAVFLTINFIFLCLKEHFDTAWQDIDPKEFCAEFTKYLETCTRKEQSEKSKVAADSSIEKSKSELSVADSIPEERPQGGVTEPKGRGSRSFEGKLSPTPQVIDIPPLNLDVLGIPPIQIPNFSSIQIEIPAQIPFQGHGKFFCERLISHTKNRSE